MDDNYNSSSSQNPNSNNYQNFQNLPYPFFQPNTQNFQNLQNYYNPQNFPFYNPNVQNQASFSHPFTYPFFNPSMTNENPNLGISGFPIPVIDPKNSDQASRTEQEKGTTDSGSFTDSQIPTYSSQPGIENIILTESPAAEIVEKRQAWSREDEKKLASAWLTISSDSIVGNGQNDKTFWKRITDYFNASRGADPPRKQNTLKQHWFWMLPFINEFNQLHNKLLGQHHSGWSDDQLKDRARELYYQNRKRNFTHEHVWVMLKDDPKWRANPPLARASKKTKVNESGAYTSSSNADTSVDEDVDVVEVRPMGQKAAKEKAKRKGKSQATDKFNNEEWEKKWRDVDEWRKEKLTKLENLQKSYELQADHQILTMDTSHMNADQLENHRFMCGVIKSKYN